jgi:hypothetical protein
MFDDKAASHVKTIPCCDNSVQRRIVEMAAVVTLQVVDEIM